MRADYAIAARLGVSVDVIAGMTVSERNHWVAFFVLQDGER
jgi:hypothetical protein